MASRNRKILILDTVSSTCYPSSMAEAHLSSPTHPTSPRAPLAGVMASAARDVSVSAGPVSTICSEPPPPVSVSRERTACPAPLEFLPIFTLSQTQRGGLGWGRGLGDGGGGKGGAAAGCCPQERQDNRGSRKNTSFYPAALRQKPRTLPQFCVAPLSCFPPPPLPRPPLTLSFSHPNP